MTKKVLIIIGVVVYLCLAVPAAYGLVRFFTSDVTGGKCVKEFTVDKFHRTQGVVHIPSTVIEIAGTQVVIQNMTCAEFKNQKEVNVFRYAHPYFSTYSILILVSTLTVILVWPIAGFFNKISLKYEAWQENRKKK